MKKPFWLKTTWMKMAVSQLICRGLVRRQRHSFPLGHKVLLISTDGLGDAFLRLSLVAALVEKLGAENIILLTKALPAPLYTRFGIKIQIYTDRHRVSPWRRWLLAKQLNQQGIARVHVLDFVFNDRFAALLNTQNRSGFQHQTQSSYDNQFSALIPKFNYVGDGLRDYAELLELHGNWMNNQVLLGSTSILNVADDILVAVGASNRARMMRRSNMTTILLSLLEQYPDRQIILLGAGELEASYAADLVRSVNQTRLVNLVGQLNLMQLIDRVNQGRLLIGFDSALYNLSFTLQRPTVCLAADNPLVLHRAPWVRIVQGTGQDYGLADGLGCLHTNSIHAEQVRLAVNELILPAR